MNKKHALAVALLVTVLVVEPSYAIKSAEEIKTGLSEGAQVLIDLLSGGLGLIWAVIGAVIAFAESKMDMGKGWIIGTLIVAFTPFILAWVLKMVYM